MKTMRRRDQTYNSLINCTEWKKIRKLYISNHPECEDCLERGLHVAATEVHHIIPIESARSESEARQLAYNYVSNLRSLCTSCHHAVHAAMSSHSSEAIRKREELRVCRMLEKFKARPVNHIDNSTDI